MEQEELKENLTNSSIWLRGLFMLFFAIIYNLVEIVTMLIVIFQFLSRLISRATNSQLLDFGFSLSIYIKQIYLFLTFNTEEKPYPFSPWPSRPLQQEPSAEKEEAKKARNDDDDDNDEAHLGV